MIHRKRLDKTNLKITLPEWLSQPCNHGISNVKSNIAPRGLEDMQGISDVQQNCVSKTSHYRAPSQGRNVRTEPHQTTSKQAYRGFQTCNKNSMPCHALPCMQAFTPNHKQGQTTRSKNGRGYPTCNKPSKAFCYQDIGRVAVLQYVRADIPGMGK